MRKLSKFQNTVDSIVVMLLLVFLSYVICNLFVSLARDIVVPVIAMFSYDFHRYLEQIEHDVTQSGVLQMWALIIWRASAIPAMLLAAPIAYRIAPSRSRYFKRVTGARIGYADGMRMYIREHAIYDVAVAAVLTFALCFLVPGGTVMFPIGSVILGIHPILTWLTMFPLTVLTVPLGAFYAQKHWRAKYICSLLD